MNLNRYLTTQYLPLPLIALMLATRFHHFGDALHLPDASLAVFFFTGFYRKPVFLGFLLVLAGVIDYLALAQGTSAFCISPAYAFLILSYAVMWGAGRMCAGFIIKNNHAWTYAKVAGVLALATTLAFVISSGSFYVLSGRFAELTWAGFAQGAAVYFPPYLGYSLMYGMAGLALVKLLKAMVLPQAENA